MNKHYIVFVLAISLIATGSIGGCGSTRYMTENPIDNKTLENIETIVDCYLNDESLIQNHHQELVLNMAKSVSENEFVNGASAILGWRFKDGKNLAKMFEELLKTKEMYHGYYFASSYEQKMEEFLIPGAKNIYSILLQSAQEILNNKKKEQENRDL